MKLDLEQSEPVTLREHQSKAGRAGRGACKRRKPAHYREMQTKRWAKHWAAKKAHAESVLKNALPTLSLFGVVKPE